MRVHVDRLRRHNSVRPLDIERQVGPWSADLPLQGVVRITGEVRQEGDRVEAALQVSGTARLTCGRCLIEFSEPVSGEITQRFVFDEASLEAEPEAWIIEGEDVEIAPLVMEALYLALPGRPLCRPDCLGLCPTCGRNRNEEPCRCSEERVDPRMEALRTLLAPPEGKET